MRARLSIMYVEYDNCDEYTETDQHHGEEKIFAQQRQRQRRRRYNFRYQQEEHGLRQQNANAQSNFLARIGRQVEYQYGEIGNADAWNDQIDGVEQCLATQCYVEEYVCVCVCVERRDENRL